MMKSESFWPAIGVTILILSVIFVPRISDIGQLLWYGDLNELGDFLAGVFTPVAFGWLIYGYILQYKEFRLQREELEQTRETLGEQVAVLKEQAEADRQRSMPMLCLEKENSVVRGMGGVEDKWSSTDPNSFILRNIGGPARNLEIIIGTDEMYWPEPPLLLDKDKTCPVYISNPFLSVDLMHLNPDTDDPHSYCRVRFTSERHERLEQRWSIRFTAKNSANPDINKITEGPTPLKDGSTVS